MTKDEHWMRAALQIARDGIRDGQTPFGACLVRGDELIAARHNHVWKEQDITAHAEVTAIREACRKLGTVNLADCTMYSTCEPCPMCFTACHWAKIPRIVFGADIADAQAAGFTELSISNRQLRELGASGVELAGGVLKEECAALFSEWLKRPDRKGY